MPAATEGAAVQIGVAGEIEWAIEASPAAAGRAAQAHLVAAEGRAAAAPALVAHVDRPAWVADAVVVLGEVADAAADSLFTSRRIL